WPSFVNIPCEFLESYYPLRIERWETVTDTGGAGLHRGGNGVDVAYRFLEPGTIAIHDDRWLTYPWGVNGGEPGARGRKWIDHEGGTRQVLPSKCHDVAVVPGDVLHFVTWGGGGWGDPLERDPALVALEVRRGLVSADGARRYGVALGPDGAVDDRATDELRGSLRSGRPDPLPVFDMGPPLAELLARCEEETGLPAPQRPVWA
ncbi:MAG: hydantoinase B/oxoprolinase family protein, partial [Jatrophihabitantaceae bacterium]